MGPTAMKLLLIAAAALALAASAQAQTGSGPKTKQAVKAAAIKPALRFIGTEDYTTGGAAFTRYRLVVDNEYEFASNLFAAAPDLPPCGSNTNSSRAWVDVHNGDGKRLYGFCALGSLDGLRRLWFAMPQGEPPPPLVYIVIHDRKTDEKSTSNAVAIPPGAAQASGQ